MSGRVSEKRTGFPIPKAFEFTVGIHAEEGAQAHEEGETIIEVAEKHEFGLGTPQRSFIRRWADEDAAALQPQIASEMQKAVKGGDPNLAAERLALFLQGKAQKFISDRRATPPNAPSTIAQKGSDTPLVDEGVLKSAILGKSEVTK